MFGDQKISFTNPLVEAILILLMVILLQLSLEVVLTTDGGSFGSGSAGSLTLSGNDMLGTGTGSMSLDLWN